MPELGTYGSVRGVPGNGHPYRDHRGVDRNYPSLWRKKAAEEGRE